METRNTTVFSVSRDAFQAALHLLGKENSPFLPQPFYSAGRGADTFLAGRNELCEMGLAELDFDGRISPTPAFARLLYDITHAEAAIKLEQPDRICWYLLAPTEMLYVEQEGDRVRLERRRAVSLLPWVREILLPAQAGTLTTQRGERLRKTELTPSSAGEEPRAKELTGHLAVFFGKE